jgi:tol-pal system protein YbgF
MKNVKTVVLFLALQAMLTGCLASQQELAMSRDLTEMKRRLAATERDLASLQSDRVGQTRQRLDTLTQQQAKTQADLDNLRLELQSISGRFSDLDRQRNESQEELALIRDDLGLRINALETQLSAGTTRTAPATQAAAATPTQPETIYLQAVDLIRKQQQYANGRKQLESFLQKNPSHALAPNAAYWIGESYLGEKEYEKAILQFEEVIRRYGDHPKAASAYLKQALTFEQLGDRQSARAILEKLAKSFPLSDEAATAKQRLKSLGK